jgi:hypothetical protein
MNPLQTFGTRLGQELALRVLTPAFAFWAGGLLALWTSGYVGDWPGRIGTLPTAMQVVLLGAAVSLVAGSAVIAEYLTLPVLRLLEGYWPGPIARPLRRLAGRRLVRSEERHQVLSGKAYRGELDDWSPLAAVEQRLHDLPGIGSLMPTRLGNILRAAEDRPRDRYGLDPVVCWPHLWLLLDKGTQQELAQARKELDESARLWLWCLLFVGWTWWAWWAPLVTMIGCSATYYGVILPRGRGYGLLMQATFDLYRQRIYQAVNWPFAEDPAAERVAGTELTTYLWRGITPPGARFIPPDGGTDRAAGPGPHDADAAAGIPTTAARAPASGPHVT